MYDIYGSLLVYFFWRAAEKRREVRGGINILLFRIEVS